MCTERGLATKLLSCCDLEASVTCDYVIYYVIYQSLCHILPKSNRVFNE